MRRIFLLALLASVLPVRAAEPDWYAVETVVFVRSGVQIPGGEILPAVQASRELAPASGTPQPYARLPDAALALTPLARRLVASGRYAVLAHAGWWQSAGTTGAPVRLDALGAGLGLGEALTGTMRVYRTQVLRVAADLALVRDAGTGPGGPVWRLHETRGMRLGEVHYLDHPGLGVLVQVRPAP
jgi:hypothetical protein